MATEYPWQSRPLSDVGEWLSGGTPSKDSAEFWSGSLPWVSPKDMKVARIGDAIDHVSSSAVGNGTRLVPSGTLLMVVRGMILAHTFPVALTTSEVTFNQDIKALRAARDLLPEFLLYWLQSRASDVLKLTDVANHGTRRLPTERLFALDVPVPPLPEQRKIAAILSSVDEVIEKTEAVIEQLQVVKKAMMQELLTCGLPGRHTRFKQTDIGQVPEEWEVVRAGSVSADERSSLVNGPFGSDLLKSDLTVSGVPVVYIRDIRDGTYLRVSEACISVPKALELSAFRVRAGDLLIAKVGDPPGTAAVYPEHEPDAVVTQDVVRLRPAPAKTHAGFLRWYMNSPVGRRELEAITIEGTRKRFALGTFKKEFRIALPQFEEQTAIAERIDSIQLRVETETRCAKEFRAVKSALLSVLLTGEIRVTPDEDAA